MTSSSVGEAGSLGAEIAVVVSNHEDLRPMAEAAGLPFIHIPVTPETKPEAEARLLELVAEYDADLVVLARYMQVLSDDSAAKLAGRAINIHHSFLPGFKGAKPYHQAYDRGVKLVGATAHYVTARPRRGPDHRAGGHPDRPHLDPDALVTVGRDAEALALSRAVRWHCQHRVLLNGTAPSSSANIPPSETGELHYERITTRRHHRRRHRRHQPRGRTCHPRLDQHHRGRAGPAGHWPAGPPRTRRAWCSRPTRPRP